MPEQAVSDRPDVTAVPPKGMPIAAANDVHIQLLAVFARSGGTGGGQVPVGPLWEWHRVRAAHPGVRQRAGHEGLLCGLHQHPELGRHRMDACAV